ncbi:lytic polysaccharide monooxygenase [Streptomyces sp. Ag109_O5-10]|uniref:lytic polysaccharide monooxygenase n=1 Tax=Streptomyces sp. Ag109_O5-10 TaxID=1855349 RepID=UPI0008970655|nr:lytic polysaccharide monooxygenase [Streptomyces sp. Ag109_O5-10]SEE35111.1 chitin-binding protein [Streptomyces sp. Ag109_O5-10]
MTRTTTRLRVAGAAAAAPLLLLSWAAGSARAHGAPTYPVSRAYGCSPSGGSAATAACRAAIAASGQNFVAWDDIRVAGVNGRDRQVIPDGRLCGGSLPAYKGLDLARADWPATELAPGARMTMTYAATIAHSGTFKLYLTKPGYDPAKPLTWSELPAQPFAEFKDPPLTNGAYHFTAALPADRTGRQVLYTVWQTSSTPDTYYSCSDVVFTAKKAPEKEAAKGAAQGGQKDGGATAGTTPRPTRTPAPGASESDASRAQRTAAATPVSPTTGPTTADSTPVASDTDPGSGPSAPLLAGGAAAVLVLTGGAALALRLRRR